MKTSKTRIHHLQGEEAYRIYWEQFYNCRPRFSTIMAIDLNLEIITDENLTLLEFRHDLPDDMQWMVINEGYWQIFNEESITPQVLLEVRGMMVRKKTELSLN